MGRVKRAVVLFFTACYIHEIEDSKTHQGDPSTISLVQERYRMYNLIFRDSNNLKAFLETRPRSLLTIAKYQPMHFFLIRQWEGIFLSDALLFPIAQCLSSSISEVRKCNKMSKIYSVTKYQIRDRPVTELFRNCSNEMFLIQRFIENICCKVSSFTWISSVQLSEIEVKGSDFVSEDIIIIILPSYQKSSF